MKLNPPGVVSSIVCVPPTSNSCLSPSVTLKLDAVGYVLFSVLAILTVASNPPVLVVGIPISIRALLDGVIELIPT